MIEEENSVNEKNIVGVNNGNGRCTNNVRGTLATLLSRNTAFPNETGALPIGEFEVIHNNSSNEEIKKHKILVVGAGGLGCEILKNLAMMCSEDNSMKMIIDIIDLDTIDITNLNRQFLFRHEDIGKSKAIIAAKFIERRCPWMKQNVIPHFCKIQDKDVDFYQSFDCVISGLDNIEARRWLNALLCGLVSLDDDGEPDDPSTIIPLIDGGTEGFKGQARVILPRITSCFECSLDTFPKKQTFPLCTIADTPRLPEHCITWAFVLQWPKIFPEKKLDADSPHDMKWVYQTALERAQKFGIQGVTYMLTLGVVKNIIPAVASTNAIVAAATVNEAFKLLTFASQTLNNYMMYMGTHSIYSHAFIYEKKDDCPVCSSLIKTITMCPTTSLNSFLQSLCTGTYRLSNPSAVSSSNKTLYMPNPPALEKATRINLDKLMKDLVMDGEDIVITDAILGHTSLTVKVTYK